MRTNIPDDTEDQRERTCPVCLAPAKVARDKKNSPYVSCRGCGTRIFLRGTTAWGLDLMHVVVATLGGAPRLRVLQSEVGSAPLLAALGQTLTLARKGLPAAINHQLTNFAWRDIADQIDEFIPNEEPNGQPER